VHQVLRLGRGAIIEVDAGEDDDTILANNLPVAKGTVVVKPRMLIEVREILARAPDMRQPRIRGQ
jgi:flagellar motor switch protein FliN/FliY